MLSSHAPPTHANAPLSHTSARCPCLPLASPTGPQQGTEVELEVSFEPTSLGESLRDTLVVASALGGEYHCPLVGSCTPSKPQGPIDLSRVRGLRGRAGGQLDACAQMPEGAAAVTLLWAGGCTAPPASRHPILPTDTPIASCPTPSCPQGPATLPLRNVFPAEAEYMLSCDNPAFMVKPSEKVPPRKAAAISIIYKPEGAGGAGGKGGSGGAPAGTAVPAAGAAAAQRTGKLTVSCPKHTSCQWVYYLQA